MEEDIEILKRIWRKLPFEDSEGRNALENLIKGYKEKDTEINKLNKVIDKICIKEKSLENRTDNIN